MTLFKVYDNYSKFLGCLNVSANDESMLTIFMHFFFSRYTFASGSPDNIKQWKFPDGNFLQNLSGHNAIINSLALNSDNVLVSGGRYLYLVNKLQASITHAFKAYHSGI